jgi:hypothetical protein
MNSMCLATPTKIVCTVVAFSGRHAKILTSPRYVDRCKEHRWAIDDDIASFSPCHLERLLITKVKALMPVEGFSWGDEY